MRFSLVKMGRQKKGAVPNYRCSPFISQDRPADVFEIYSYYLPKNQIISFAVRRSRDRDGQSGKDDQHKQKESGTYHVPKQ